MFEFGFICYLSECFDFYLTFKTEDAFLQANTNNSITIKPKYNFHASTPTSTEKVKT